MNKLPSFIRILLIFIVFLVLEGASLLLIKKDSIIQQYTIMEMVRSVQSHSWEYGETIRSYFFLAEVNKNLAEENNNLKRTLEAYERNMEKDSTITIPPPLDSACYKYTVATIIRNSTNKFHNYIVIDKGENDGIKPDMGVISAKGVIGYVVSTGRHYSRIVSFLDIDHKVSTLIKRTNTFGPLSWEGRYIDKAILQDIPIHSQLVLGDTIITSGYSAMYPPNIPIGTIESSKIVGGIYQNAIIRLFEDFNSLQYVYVVENLSKAEIDSLYNEKEVKNE